MRALLQRLSRRLPTEHGMSLIEVVVAMMIFTVLSLAVLGSLIQILAVNRDNRMRQVAANLAAQEIDLVRETQDLFAFDGGVRTESIDGTDFIVNTATGWETNGASSDACGANGGGGILRYKRVNVEVGWEGMRPGATPVTSDTVIDPETRINDPALGTILVAVTGAGGTGVSGVGVTVTAVGSGAVTPSPQPALTDAQGCSYALRLQPGDYKVAVSRSGFVSNENVATTSTQVTVKPSTAVSVPLTYDQAINLKTTYVAAGASASTTFIPDALITTFSHSNGNFPSVAPSASLSRTTPLFPWSDGYRAIAGGYKPKGLEDSAAPFCLSPDPGTWPADAIHAAGATPIAVAAAPGGNASTVVPMGTFKFTGTGAFHTIRATSVAGVGADPGCTTGDVYTFSVSGKAMNGAVLALPYGTWKLEGKTSSSGTYSALNFNRLTATPGLTLNGTTSITLDPRPVIAP